ncbi:hypothetical protein PRK78_001847 [Emydomyces testavorans]|uniref:5'-3' DNA helicase ZGRF1-like N-terminal domain-containing protein n=1 Tax=Emydomyces testavorans TaxID=2070801 RepID=A0AAF0DE00_9EURO|nr:hypothetical protein PRK78_001847 [Emydomyces testavorans]
MSLAFPTRATTTSFSVGTSQYTAPVIKFRCLYTFDVKRKAKRWQDGYLQFHTFNRRAMVYGSSSDLIGDIYVRGNDGVQGGQQLELERGVLVDVGECLEKTETDLTELLDKRKSNAVMSSSKTVLRRMSTAPGNGSSLMNPSAQAKPLSELLGKHRTSIGRAVLPTKSPFEIRHENNQYDRAAERPTKRRKHSPAQENEQESFRDSRTSLGNTRNRTLQSETNDSEHTAIGFQSGSRQKLSNEPLMSFQPASALKIAASNRSNHSLKESRKAISSNQKSITSMLSGEKPITLFPSSTERPRKKLLCLEMIKRPMAANQSIQAKTTGGTRNSTGQRDKANTFEDNCATAMGGLARHRGEKINVLTPVSGNCTMEFAPSTSTMRVLEESFNETDVPPSSQTITKSISDFFKPSQPPPQSLDEHKENAGQVPQPRSLLRSHSDIEPLARQSTKNTTALPSNHAAPNRSDPAQKSHGKGLLKSLSDTSALRAKPTGPSRALQTRLMTAADSSATSSTMDDEEQGPWTSEALDLFDWWPPGRPKPGIRKESDMHC